MERLVFSTEIDAPKEKIWRAMLDDATYRQWTSVFTEGSHAVTDWQEGSKVLFLGPDGRGMVSRIKAHRPNEFLSIEHLGELKDGVEHIYTNDWYGALENYRLEENGSTCKLTIEMDCDGEFSGYLRKTWPLALEKLKAIAEA